MPAVLRADNSALCALAAAVKSAKGTATAAMLAACLTVPLVVAVAAEPVSPART